MDLELDTFEYEKDTSIGTIQIEQVENGTKIIVELFPENQSKESFESAEFSQVYDILELAPCCIYGYNNLNFPCPIGTTEEEKSEIIRAILRGVEDMLETILNLRDFTEHPTYSILEKIRRSYLESEINDYITYRATEKINANKLKGLKIGYLENAFKLIDTINETDEKRTEHLKGYLESK